MQLNYIANTYVASSSGKTIPVLDPSDGQVFDEIQRSTAKDIDTAVSAARECFDLVWHRINPAERGRLLMRLFVAVATNADELALLEQRDCDKLHGETLPYLDGYSVMTWRDRPHRAVELPHANFWSQRGRRTGCRQCVRRQAERRCLLEPASGCRACG